MVWPHAVTAQRDSFRQDAWRGESLGLSAEQSAGSTIDWAALHSTTRLLPTVTTFGWRVKVLLSAPPVMVLGWWTATGAFFNGAIAMVFGVPMLAASIWWSRQVWAPGPASPPVWRSPCTVSTPLQPPRPMHPAMAYLYESKPRAGSAGVNAEETFQPPTI